MVKNALFFFSLPIFVLLVSCSAPVDNVSIPDYHSFPKIDAHVHLDTYKSDFPKLAQEHNFRLMTLVTRSASQEHIDREFAWASTQHKEFPETVFFATTISMEHWSEPDWQQATIDRLKRDFDEGAHAVKFWKDIGMTFREPDGTFIMIDNPRFDPVIDFIASQGKVMIGHLGEPRNCWLPVDEMTVSGDKSYFTRNPQYHMYLHPDFPSYEDQVDARDRMLAKHKDLVFVGAHLGSLEWNTDELAKRLDRFPNMAVDMAARISHFQVQNRDKVREFIIKYQDRLLYATDKGDSDDRDQSNLDTIAATWKGDWRYFATDETMTSSAVPEAFVGLKLPLPVLKKIYHDNAKQWLKL